MSELLVRTIKLTGLLLVAYAAFAAVGWDAWSDPLGKLRSYGGAAGAVSAALLWLDLVLPLPSSLLMIANGALFGITAGASVSVAGCLAASLTGFWLGRRGSRWMGADANAAAWIQRWGVLAVALTRPVPILAESVAVAAGAGGMKWSAMAAASIIGLLPAALMYAYAGSRSVEPAGASLVFLATMGVSGLLWWVGRGRPGRA